MSAVRSFQKPRKTPKGASAQWPSVDWEGNNQALTWALIELMRQKDRYRAGIWSRPGDKVVGKKKIHVCTEIAEELLGKDGKYAKYVGADPARYGESVKQKLARLAKLYAEKKRELGQTGAGLVDADEIKDTSSIKLRNIWDQVKQKCPYFYHLRDLLGERTNVGEHTRANSQTTISTQVLETGRQPQQPKILQAEEEKIAEVGLRGRTNSIAIEEIGESSQRTEGILEVGECEEGTSEREGWHIDGKHLEEQEYGSIKDQIDSDYDYQDTSIEQLTIPPPSTPKAESDSDLPFKGTCPHSDAGNTSNLKRTLPSHLQRSKGGKDNELAEAWLTANIAKNERKRKRDELEQERLDRKFQQEVELRRMEMAHEERMMEKKIELARLVKGSGNDFLQE